MTDEHINRSEAVEIKIEDGDQPEAGDESLKVEQTEEGTEGRAEASSESVCEENPEECRGEEQEGDPEGSPEAEGEEGSEDVSEEEDRTDASDETENPDEEENTAETEKPRESVMFGRKKKEIDKCHQKIDELTDRLKRSMAEFENFRKRTEKEKSGMYLIGAKDIVEKILPVVDSFERGLSQAPEDDAFAEGMKLVYRQLMTALEDAGVTVIETEGRKFDPNLHNAVMHVEDENLGENMIAEEFQKGYMYKDSVVRHSMVKVAN